MNPDSAHNMTRGRDRRLAELGAHLSAGEKNVPPAVLRTATRLVAADIWWAISRNPTATSCRDAARQRVRLGGRGVELWNELKSMLGVVIEGDGRGEAFMAHCRGDRELDLDAAAAALGCRRVARMEPDAVSAMGSAYGLVNPFESWTEHPSKMRQIVDDEVLRHFGPCATMTTNAGDHTWGVELDAKAYFERHGSAVVARISRQESEPDPTVRGPREGGSIVILTGNAPESGIALWGEVNRTLRETMGTLFLGDVSMPETTVRSLPVLGLTMELDRRESRVWGSLRDEIEAVCRTYRPKYLAIACNTTHYFTERVREACFTHGTQFVSIAESVGDWLRAREVKKVALVGISFVADLGPYSAYRTALDGIEVERVSGAAMGNLQNLAYQVKAEGVTESGLNRLRDILRSELQSRHVILALTELSLLLGSQRRRGRSDRVLIDPLSLYGEAIAHRYLGLPYPSRRPEFD